MLRPDSFVTSWAVLSPAAPLLTAADLRDRVERGNIRHIITDGAGLAKCAELPGVLTRIAVDGKAPGWLDYAAADACSNQFHLEAG